MGVSVRDRTTLNETPTNSSVIPLYSSYKQSYRELTTSVYRSGSRSTCHERE